MARGKSLAPREKRKGGHVKRPWKAKESQLKPSSQSLLFPLLFFTFALKTLLSFLKLFGNSAQYPQLVITKYRVSIFDFSKMLIAFAGMSLCIPALASLKTRKVKQTLTWSQSVRGGCTLGASVSCPPPPCANAGNYTEPTGPSLDSLSVVSATSPAQLKEQRGVLKVNAVPLTEPAALGAVTNRRALSDNRLFVLKMAQCYKK